MKKLLSLLVIFAMVLALVPAVTAGAAEADPLAEALNGYYQIQDQQGRVTGGIEFIPTNAGALSGVAIMTDTTGAENGQFNYAYEDGTLSGGYYRFEISETYSIRIFLGKQDRQGHPLVRGEMPVEEIVNLVVGTNSLKVKVTNTNAEYLKVTFKARQAGTYVFGFSDNLEIEGYNMSSLTAGVELEANGSVTFRIYDNDYFTNGEKDATITITKQAVEDGGTTPDGGENTGSENTGSENTGGENTGSENTGGENTGSENTGGENTGGENTGSENTGGENNGSGNTGSGNTGSENTGSENTDNGGDTEAAGDADEGKENPDSGDSSMIFVMVGMAALMAAVLLGSKKYRF